MARGKLRNADLATDAAIASSKLAAWSVNRSAGGFKLTSLANGTAGGDAVNLTQLNAVSVVAAGAVPQTRIIGTVAPLTGGGELSADLALSIPASSSSVDGYLSATDWQTFNGKQAALGFTPENVANKAVNMSVVNNTLYPTILLMKTFAESLVVGLLDDRGNWDASGNTFPSSGGSGTAGAILKGDLWFISVAGTLAGSAVGVGDQIRALVDSPASNLTDWGISEGNIGYAPEHVLTFSTGLTRTVNTVSVNATQNITNLSNLTSNGVIQTSGSNGTLSVLSLASGYLPKSNGAGLTASAIRDDGTLVRILRGQISCDFRTSPLADTGALNAYVITPSPPAGAYVDALVYHFTPATTNTITTPTVNVSGLGNKTIWKTANDGVNVIAVAPGDLVAGEIVTIDYVSNVDSGSGGFVMANPTPPVGLHIRGDGVISRSSRELPLIFLADGVTRTAADLFVFKSTDNQLECFTVAFNSVKIGNGVLRIFDNLTPGGEAVLTYSEGDGSPGLYVTSSFLRVDAGFAPLTLKVTGHSLPIAVQGEFAFLVDTSDNASAINLDDNPSPVGRQLMFLDIGNNAKANNIVLNAGGGNTINGASSYTMGVNGDGVFLFKGSDTEWFAFKVSGKVATTDLDVTAQTQAFLADPTSAKFAAMVTDENGAGKVIFANGTLSIASGKTLTASNTLTFTGNDSSSIDFATGGTVFYTAGGTFTGQIVTRAGATGANTAGIKLQSGALNTTAEAGAFEFLTDAFYLTKTTGPTRTSIVLGPSAGPITFAGPTAARTITLPNANATLARTDAAQTFTGGNTFTGANTFNAASGAIPVTIAGAGNTLTIPALKVTGDAEILALFEMSGGTGGQVVSLFCPSLNDGQKTFFTTGTAWTAGNAGYLGFYRAGAGNAANRCFMGFHSKDFILACYYSGGVTIGSSNNTDPGDGVLNVSGNIVSGGGDFVCATAGKGLQVKSGTGQRAGNTTLVGGTKTVTNTTVNSTLDILILTRKTAGGTIGNLTYTLSNGVSFTINSDNALDTSVVSYMLVRVN